MFRKNINITPQTMRGCSCIGSQCNTLVVSMFDMLCLHREKGIKELLMIFRLLLTSIVRDGRADLAGSSFFLVLLEAVEGEECWQTVRLLSYELWGKTILSSEIFRIAV